MSPGVLEQLEGKYEVLEKISEGGMGAVYKVRHRLLDEVHVVKLIRPQLEHDHVVRSRFLREARTTVRLRHPNIAQFFDLTMDAEGNAFIVMEFVNGATIEALVERAGPLPPALALQLAIQSLQALAYLHRRSIIHRDVSPDNLMVAVGEEGGPQVKLIDLGIAKILGGESKLTATGTFLGKVRYASPEQFRAQSTDAIDARSDLYSMGIVTYEMLTGMHPVRGSDLSSLIAGHLLHPPVPFSESDRRGRVPEDLQAIVMRALEKQPEERFATAADFIAALSTVATRFPLDVAGFAALMGRLVAGPVGPEPVGGAVTTALDSGGEPGEGQREGAPPTVADVTSRPERHGHDVDSLLADARLLLDAGRAREALLKLERVVSLDASSDEAKVLMGSARAALYGAEQAATAVTEAGDVPEAASNATVENVAGAGAGIPLAATPASAAESPEPGEAGDLRPAQAVATPAVRAPEPSAEAARQAAVIRAVPPLRRWSRRPAWRWAVGAVVVVAVVVGVAVVGDLVWHGPRPQSPSSQGTLVINAVPWGRVQEVVDARGRRVEIRPDIFTPASLSLPSGRYTVSLVNPDSARQVRFEAEVVAGQVVRRQVELGRLDEGELLRGLGLGH